MIFIIKVTTNKEERAVDMIANRIEKKNINVFSVAIPHGLRGYILLEAEDRDSAEEAVFNLPYVKGIIGETVTYDKVKQMLEPVCSRYQNRKERHHRNNLRTFQKRKGKSCSSR